MLEERSQNKGYGAHTSVAHPSIFKQRPQPAGTSFWTWSQCADSKVLEWFLSVPNRSTKIVGAHRAKPHLHPDITKSDSSDHRRPAPSLQLDFCRLHALPCPSHGCTCWFSRCEPHRGQWFFCSQPGHPESQKSTWWQQVLYCWVNSKCFWRDFRQLNEWQPEK